MYALFTYIILYIPLYIIIFFLMLTAIESMVFFCGSSSFSQNEKVSHCAIDISSYLCVIVLRIVPQSFDKLKYL